MTDRRILEPGRNCWQIAPANRAVVLIDAENYFRRLAQVLGKARRSILIAGWDFDARIQLCPQEEGCPALGDLLRKLVDERPELEVHILIWSVAVVHAPGAPLPLLLGADWDNHPRIHLRLDTAHPFYGAHHQKIVCVDEKVAFVGGIDLTVRRWDTCKHNADDPLRLNPEGGAYTPVHDIQMMVEGDVAGVVADVVRDRWKRALGTVPEPRASDHDLWPDDLEPHFTDSPVGVARTFPQWGSAPAAREAAALTDDAILAARHAIYIEAQYLTAPRVAKLLAKRLAQPDGPEVVVILTKEPQGLIERFVMGRNRNRAIRRLRKADRFNRLRVFYPVVPASDGDCPIHIHAKLMIVDDMLLRVGSANLNNRSIGLDTECDLAVEGRDEETCRQISRIRDELIGEHLDIAPEQVGKTLESAGSLIAGIEKLNCNERCLREIPKPRRGPTGPILGTSILDPVRPFEPPWYLRRKKPRAAEAQS